MKARGKNFVQVFMSVLVVCLLVLTYTAYAAPATTQKSPQQVQPAGSASPASVKYDPNAPPKGTITIPASSKGNVNASTWVTGSYQYIQWTCNGTSSNLVDVTLWQNNKQFVVISKGIASGQTGSTVPIQMAAGNYEVRITSQGDPRVEARKAVTVKLAGIKITAPKQNETIYLGSQYKITWTYDGNPGPVEFSLTGNWAKGGLFVPAEKMPGSVSSITMANGQGSAVWQLPSQPFWDPTSQGLLYHITMQGKTNRNIMADSAKFGLSCRNSYCVVRDLRGIHHACADLQTDKDNCGSCGSDCEIRLGHLVECVKGKCICTPNATLCAGKDKYSCVDLKDNQWNCGSCGNECGAWPSSCQNGSCVCLSPNLMCGGKCLDPTTDAKNCGKCGNACTYPNFYCLGGNCQKNDPNMPADPSETLPKYWGR